MTVTPALLFFWKVLFWLQIVATLLNFGVILVAHYHRVPIDFRWLLLVGTVGLGVAHFTDRSIKWHESQPSSGN